ncbi:DUF3592 domain-containing protein [Variovorax paradoxus]|uniref:DUF3592 domain-containing protein n=1 Tax=Variovorax paradoxus TaxID=34073 RepID=UPI003D651225
MTEDTATHALVFLMLSIPAGLVVGGLVAWRTTFFWGIGVGALLVGCSGLYGAATVGCERHQSLAASAFVQGRLIEFLLERDEDSEGRVTWTRSPVVEYVASDGQARRFTALGGGLRDKEPGNSVNVRYSTTDPAEALVGDFQNTWAIVWTLGMFGGFSTLIGLFFTTKAYRENRIEEIDGAWRRAPSSTFRRLRAAGTAGANVVLATGVLLLCADDNIARALGAGFTTLGFGMLLHFLTQSLPPAMDLESRFILGIVGAVFTALGYVVWRIAS